VSPREPRRCCAPLGDTTGLELAEVALCGAPATEQREVEGVVWDLCTAHAASLDRETKTAPAEPGPEERVKKPEYRTIDGIRYRSDPEGAAIEDCDCLIGEGSDPVELADDCGEPDEALIQAMGRRFVCLLAGAPDDSEESWSTYALAWCAQYNAAFRANASKQAEEP
jgi:hypothetical protein